ncbi:MAG TPA: LysR family transcriptional regulator [Polyangiaceae bacterium]
MKTSNVDTSIQLSLKIRGGPLAQLPVFLEVAERRSFSAAARALGLSVSAVSQAVTRLESEVGTPLLVRTTRSVNVTDAGARLVSEAGPAVTAAGAALSALAANRTEAAGTLRLNVPRIASGALRPILAAYARAHPSVRTDVFVDDRNVDIVAEGFDAGIRLQEAVQKDMITVRVSAPFRFVVVASRRYLAKHGRPSHPRELVAHECLGWRSPTTGELWRWEFEQRGRAIEVAVDGPIRSTDGDLLAACAEDHLGFAYVAEHEARGQLASGKLESVLEEFCPEVPGLFLYYPRAARRVPKLAAFVACARDLLERR